MASCIISHSNSGEILSFGGFYVFYYPETLDFLRVGTDSSIVSTDLHLVYQFWICNEDVKQWIWCVYKVIYLCYILIANK